MDTPQLFPDDLVIRAAQEFRGCIECSANHMTSVTYFHKPDCHRGLGLPLEIFKARLLERIQYLESHPRRPLWTLPTQRCSFCSKTSTGTHWVRYHRRQIILLQEPVCEDHSSQLDQAGRESGYIPGKVFETIFDVDDFLGGLDGL